jgi:hypothetical protein
MIYIAFAVKLVGVACIFIGLITITRVILSEIRLNKEVIKAREREREALNKILNQKRNQSPMMGGFGKTPYEQPVPTVQLRQAVQITRSLQPPPLPFKKGK